MYELEGMNNQQIAEYFIEFTKLYKACKHMGKGKREAKILDFQYPQLCIKKQKNEIFVSRCLYPPLMLSPQSESSLEENSQLGYCFNKELFLKIENNSNISHETRKDLTEIRKYWEKEKTVNKIRQSYPKEMAEALSVEDYEKKRAVGYPLYRMSGTQLNFGKLLKKGVSGIKSEIQERLFSAKNDELEFLSAGLDWLKTFKNVCLAYAKDIHDDKNLKTCLLIIATKPPQTFYQALQLVLLWWILSGTLNLERMDTYLTEFYLRDIKNKIIDENEALNLLSKFYYHLALRDHMYDTRIVIGGKDRQNQFECDLFCKLAINAVRKNHSNIPQLALRCYKGMDQSVWNLALEANGEGCTYPMLYNDDVNIPAVSEAFQIPLETAAEYCPFGCGEYVLSHLSVGTPSGIINLAKALEVTLNRGKDIETEEKIGIDCGPLASFKTFDDLLKAYKKQVEFFVRFLAEQEKIEYEICAEEVEFIPLSLLYEDCIQKAKPLLSGGVRYLGGTLESYGNVNTADSLTAIKELVYERKEISLTQVFEALKSNFKGFDKMHQQMLECPKYGNDNPIADEMLVKINKHICNYARNQAASAGLDSYLVVIINNNTNTVLGKLTSATPDGREAHKFLANANNPQGSADNKGLTAMLNSIVKPPVNIHAGSVQNIKFSKIMFSKRMIAKTSAILSVYFENGGSQIMITVTSPGEMKDAMVHPENHQNLLVRIGGFSARFVDLDKDTQKELISRTLY